MTIRQSNAAVANSLERHGRLLEIAGESSFRGRAFTRAAESLRALDVPVADLAAQGRLRELPGIGQALADSIEQIIETGSFDAHQELTRAYPESLLELLSIPGVGAKTAMKLHQLLAVTDLESLEAALNNGSVGAAKGLGSRAESTIREGLEELKRRSGRIPLGIALPVGRALQATYEHLRPRDRISLAGSARRWDVTVGDLDLVIATDDPHSARAALGSMAMVTEVEPTSATSVRLSLDSGLEADVYLTSPSQWGSTLVRATGSAGHLEGLGSIPPEMASEEDVYAARSLPFIPPELRDGTDEFMRWQEIPTLVTIDDIRGEFHSHTTWSDGKASIEEMAAAARRRDYEFLGISDHSHGLGVAGGLDAERLAAQSQAIRSVGAVDGVRLLAGAEVEVLRDGALDFDDETLGQLDVVVASLHTGLRQPREQLTGRLIEVLNNPNVDIIAHPSGRLLERREGGDFDWDRVFVKAAETGTALEINADPARLDLDPTLARRASAAGCLLTINCDAHTPDGFQVMEFGVAMARKAWLTPERILNCWPRADVLRWLDKRGNRA